jgi:hypothetical protein
MHPYGFLPGSPRLQESQENELAEEIITDIIFDILTDNTPVSTDVLKIIYDYLIVLRSLTQGLEMKMLMK